MKEIVSATGQRRLERSAPTGIGRPSRFAVLLRVWMAALALTSMGDPRAAAAGTCHNVLTRSLE